MTTLAREPGGGLIVPPDGFLISHSKLIIELAAREKLPAIYGFTVFAVQGGLLRMASSCLSNSERLEYMPAAFCGGEKPADLPVQQPSQYEFVINLKAAKALGLHIPPTALASADKVIE